MILLECLVEENFLRTHSEYCPYIQKIRVRWIRFCDLNETEGLSRGRKLG
jgi:hypothetical protein